MKSIHSRPDLSVVRIYKQGKIVGAGFLVSDEYILTCAHVLADPDSPEEKPTQEIELDFPTIKPEEILKAKVEFWLPVKPKDSPEDIAALKLIEPPPKVARSASLSVTDGEISERKFEAYGFPEDREEKGIWVEGVIKRNIAYGWIQLVGTHVGIENKKVYYLEEGFSGTPIWVKDLGVVGMAVAVDNRRPEAEVAFMIPTELLLEAWDKLSEVGAIDSRIQLLITLLKPYFQDFKNYIEIAYQKSLPQLYVRNFPDSIAEIVRSLDSRENDSEDDYSCLEKFVCYLLLSLKDLDDKAQLRQSLTNWLNSYLGDKRTEDLLGLLKSKRQIEKVFNESQKPCLIVAIFEDNNSYTVEGWLIEDVRDYQPNEEAGCHSLTDESNKKTTDRKLSNLREIINFLIKKSIACCFLEIQKIQFFLPSKLIVNNLEFLYSLILNPERYFKQTINAEYEISIRLSPRLRGAGEDLILKWFNKGKYLNRQKMQPAVKVLKNQNCSSPDELYNELKSPKIVAVRLNKVIQKSKLEWVIAAFLERGIPLALWMRKEIEGIDCCQALEDICQNCCLEELSEKIKNQSRKTSHIGSCLSLLWDDPTLVPPEYAPEHVLKMP
ncbi:MAG: trypsin-like peptidase domain-containing protein [Pleurocapsa sp. MO_192.B19]|nr:trypsin-like peptidase domain-containing protein [Pleurocapsa sp. MO_192.B19]